MRRPQCAKDYEPQFINSWPRIVQPKKDGVRGMVEDSGDPFDDTKCVVTTAWVRPRDKKKPIIQHKYHIQDKVQRWFKGIQLPGALDGELFVPGMHFEDISSGVRGPKSKYHDQMEYHVFDIMDDTMICAERLDMLARWYAQLPKETRRWVKLVPCKLVEDADEMGRMMDLWSKTDEGIIIRDPKERYAFNSKTRGCMRWKYKLDAEYPVYAIVDGIGKDVGVPTFWCYDPKLGGPNDKVAQFKAASTGEYDKRRAIFDDRANIIGKKLVKAQFQNLTKRGVPRFGKVLAVLEKDYE